MNISLIPLGTLFIFSLFLTPLHAQNREEKVITFYEKYIALNFGITANQPDLLGYRIDDVYQKGVSIKEIALSQGDLVIDYQFLNPDEAQYFDITISLLSDKMDSVYYYSREIFGDHRRIQASATHTYQIILSDIVSKLIPFSGYYLLGLQISGSSIPPVNCGEEPQWNLSKQWPHYATAAVAVGGLLYSIPVQAEADAKYDNYKEQTSEDIAASIYDDANQQRHTYLILRYASFGILALNGVLFLVRNRIYKKRLSKYRKYCSPVSIEPTYQLNSSSGGGTLGLKLKYNF